MAKFYDINNYKYYDVLQEILKLDIDQYDLHQFLRNLIDIKNNNHRPNKSADSEPLFFVSQVQNEMLTYIDDISEETSSIYDWPELYVPKYYTPDCSYNYLCVHILSTIDYEYPIMEKYVKNKFKKYIEKFEKIPTLIEANLHVLFKGSAVGDHIDQDQYPSESETGRTNIIITLNNPSNAILICGEEYPISEKQIIAFNAQYNHAGVNLGTDDWIAIILHVPTSDFLKNRDDNKNYNKRN